MIICPQMLHENLSIASLHNVGGRHTDRLTERFITTATNTEERRFEVKQITAKIKHSETWYTSEAFVYNCRHPVVSTPAANSRATKLTTW